MQPYYFVRPLDWEPSYLESWVHYTMSNAVEESIRRFESIFHKTFDETYGVFCLENIKPLCTGLNSQRS